MSAQPDERATNCSRPLRLAAVSAVALTVAIGCRAQSPHPPAPASARGAALAARAPHLQQRASTLPTPQPPLLHASEMKALLDSLPSCSALLDAPIKARPQASYMPLMRQLGVARAYFVFVSSDDILRTYFKRLDGPHAIIRDPSWLKRIASSGLQSELDAATLAEVSRPVAQPRAGDADPAVEFLAQPFLEPDPEARRPLTIVPLFGMRLNVAIATGDAPAVRTALSWYRARAARLDLDSFLANAVVTPYDNRAAISALINAGADPNTDIGSPEMPSPLVGILAKMPDYSPCNLDPLLAAGARLDIRDAAGQTPLDLAKKSGNAYAIHAIEAALAQRRR